MTRRYGQIIRVSEDEIGSALVADTAAGATTLTVRNAADFDEDRGGKLSINGQGITYTKVDDDTGVITLNGTLAADADEGDQVALYDTKRDTIVVEKTALVEVGEGKSDAIHATIAAHLVRQLPEGPRGDDGEAVVIERDEDGDWTVIDVLGLGDPSASGLQAETDDFYILTAADIAAGAATIPLSHRPADEWLVAFWRTVPQEPTEYTINYDAQTITWPLSGFETAGDRLWVHYAYLKGIATPAVDAPTVEYGAKWRYLQVASADSMDRSANGYDDSTWAVGSAPFGSSNGPHPKAGWPQRVTQWNANTDIWIRQHIEAKVGQEFTVNVRIDNDVWVYWNGVLVASGSDPAFTTFTATVTADRADNVLAVRGHDYGAPSYLDVAVLR